MYVGTIISYVILVLTGFLQSLVLYFYLHGRVVSVVDVFVRLCFITACTF
jgi:hypothetical protein